MKRLFYDIQITGHHSEYIGHLVDYICNNPDGNTYFFVLHPEFSSLFPEIIAKAAKATSIEFIYVSEEEYQSCQIDKNTKRSFAEYRLMNWYAQKFKADHVILLNYNIFQIATIYKRSNFSLSGIYFAPYPRMQLQSLKSKVVYLRKAFRTRFSVHNSNIKTLFVLNDQISTDYLNKSLNTSVFRMLPDPIPQLIPLEDFDIYKHYNIERTRKIFLHLGALRFNKGTLEIVEAARYFSTSLQKKVAILIVGKTSDKLLQQQLHESIAWTNENTEIIVTWDEEFVSNDMMKSLFEQCDAVLMPYKSPEASSGILGHAAAAHKPVLASGNGLIGELVKKNKLGVTIENIAAKDIAIQIQEILMKKEHSDFIFENFVNDHSKVLFAQNLLTIDSK